MNLKIILVRILYIVADPIRKIYWFVFRTENFGVKAIIRHNDKILLIRNSYGRQIWTLPGGAVKRGEELEQSLKRELAEEVGIEVKSEPKLLGSFINEIEYKKDNVSVFLVDVESEFVKIDNVEVVEAKWFAVKEIPKSVGSVVVRSVELLNKFTNK